MSACEWCWAEANRLAFYLGGSVAQRYAEVLMDEESLGTSAHCPEARQNSMQRDAR